MGKVRDFFSERWATADTARAVSYNPISFATYLEQFRYLGSSYSAAVNQTQPGEGREKIAGNFASIVQGAYKDNGVIFACILARMLLFAEARFLFRDLNDEGRPGKLEWHPNLRPLERPWPGGTTGDLLARAEQDVSLGGDSFTVRNGDQLQRLRPDWVTIVSGSPRESGSMYDIGAQKLGYVYQPGGPQEGRDPVFLSVEEVAHYAPIPDPVAPWRGMSWLRAVLPEVDADSAATSHKFQFFNNGATVNLHVHFPDLVETIGDFLEWKREFNEEHQGLENAYKTVFTAGAGASVQPVGSTFEQTQFKATQGAGETRIAAAAGVPPIIVGLSEGLASATYSNYAQARRRFVDLTMRPLWRNYAASIEPLIAPPGSNSPLRRSQLWYDDRDIPALREDEKERAEIQGQQASAIRQLTDGGFTPKSVVDAIATGELSKLEYDESVKPVQVQQTKQLPPSNGNGAQPQELVAAEQED